MTSSNGNIFLVNGHLCEEFTGHRWIPRTKASDAKLWCVLWSALNKRLSKQWWGCWFESWKYFLTQVPPRFRKISKQQRPLWMLREVPIANYNRISSYIYSVNTDINISWVLSAKTKISPLGTKSRAIMIQLFTLTHLMSLLIGAWMTRTKQCHLCLR